MSAWLKVPGFKKGLMSNLIGPESQVKRVFWSSCSSRSLTLEFYFFLLMLLTKFYNNTNFSVGVNFCTASSSSNAHTIAIAKDLPAFAANALKVFSNPTLVRKEIYSSLKGKTGIYMFFNAPTFTVGVLYSDYYDNSNQNYRKVFDFDYLSEIETKTRRMGVFI